MGASAGALRLADQSPDGIAVLSWLVAGAVALAAGMGVVLGAARALALRGSVSHPWRWVGGSAAAWPGAMVVIFWGASSAPASWSTGSIVLLGAVIGALAGALLGLVTGAFLSRWDVRRESLVLPDRWTSRVTTQLKRG